MVERSGLAHGAEACGLLKPHPLLHSEITCEFYQRTLLNPKGPRKRGDRTGKDGDGEGVDCVGQSRSSLLPLHSASALLTREGFPHFYCIQVRYCGLAASSVWDPWDGRHLRGSGAGAQKGSV